MDLMTGKKEEKFRQEMEAHMEAVGECLSMLKDAVGDFFETGDVEKCYKVIELESKADKQRRKVQAELFEGAFFPTLRGDFFNLIEVMDHVANQTEDVADLLAFVKPSVPADYTKDVTTILSETLEAFAFLRESMKSLEDTTKSVSLIGKVREKEKVVDDIRRDLIKRLFIDKGKLDNKVLVKELIETAAKITNVIEDVSDILFIMVIKMQM